MVSGAGDWYVVCAVGRGRGLGLRMLGGAGGESGGEKKRVEKGADGRLCF